jgi:hypothetical protein
VAALLQVIYTCRQVGGQKARLDQHSSMFEERASVTTIFEGVEFLCQRMFLKSRSIEVLVGVVEQYMHLWESLNY